MEAIAEAFAGFVKVKEAEVAAQRNNLTDSLGVELQSFLKTQTSKEAIDLLEKQIAVISRKIEQCHCDEQHHRCQEALKS